MQNITLGLQQAHDNFLLYVRDIMEAILDVFPALSRKGKFEDGSFQINSLLFHVRYTVQGLITWQSNA
jgi:hypothetical protein